MKRIRRRITAAILVLAVIATTVVGFRWWHIHQMNELRQQLTDEMEANELMDQRIQEILGELDASKSENESLAAQIADLLTEEVVVFDAKAIKEEILEIGELATVEYFFTEVGTVDGQKDIKIIKSTVPVPFTKKTAVVSMDGTLKAGVDLKKVDILVDEDSKSITVKIPEAKILSVELDEDSMQVHQEEESIWGQLTLSDNSSLRSEIKDEAIKKATDHGLLSQAHDLAGKYIKYLIESVPSVKDTYTITIR